MRVLGYVVSLIGIGVLSLGIGPIHEYAVANFEVVQGVPNYYFFIGGVVVLAAGVILLRKGVDVGRGSFEVPIYRGNHIVGYRRNS